MLSVFGATEVGDIIEDLVGTTTDVLVAALPWVLGLFAGLVALAIAIRYFRNYIGKR